MIYRDTKRANDERCDAPHPPLELNDGVVIGGGIAGLTVAEILSKAGLKVTVFEREPQAGGGGSRVCRGNRKFFGFSSLTAEHTRC